MKLSIPLLCINFVATKPCPWQASHTSVPSPLPASLGRLVSSRIECLIHDKYDMFRLHLGSLIPQTSQWPQKGSAS